MCSHKINSIFIYFLKVYIILSLKVFNLEITHILLSLLQNTQSLKCDICGQEFTKQMLYRRHMENHAEEKPHKCPKCPASFNIPVSSFAIFCINEKIHQVLYLNFN